MTQLTSSEAMHIALVGSRQYHAKTASAGTDQIQPDTRLVAHETLAQRMHKTAELLWQRNPNDPYVPGLQKAAGYINNGYPAVDAISASFADTNMAKEAAAFAEDLAVDVVSDVILDDFQRKVDTHRRIKTASASRSQSALNRFNQLIQLSSNRQR
jgi:hypothetical protein